MTGDDNIRSLFRRADAQLGYAPPELHATIERGRRQQLRRRVEAVGVVAVVALVAFAGWNAFRPEVSELTPAATPATIPTPLPPSLRPCGDLDAAADITEIHKFIATFMDRRVDGSGAEACMSEMAVDAYRMQSGDTYDPDAFGGAGNMCLYSCGPFSVVGYDARRSEPRAVDANSYEVDVVVLLSDARETIRVTEILSIGPGTNADGNRQELVVRGAGTTGGLP